MITKHGLVALGIGVAGMSCLAPTEITVVLHTDVPCSIAKANTVGVAVTKPGGDESAGFGAVGSQCDDSGGLGTVVVLPHSIDDSVGIRVVLGVNKPTSQCTAPQYDGCIVARRSISFIPHTPLTLPIDLDQACVGTPCDPHSTCVSPQTCADAGTTCTNGTCGLPDAGVSGCVEFGPIPVPIASQQIPMASPHIARTPAGGWAIAYESPLGVLHALTLDGSGAVVAQDAVMHQLSGGGYFGPIASDGASYALTYFEGAQVVFDWRTQAGQLVRPSVPLGGTAPAIGIVWDDTAKHAVLTSTSTTTVNVYEIDQNVSTPVSVFGSNPTSSSITIGDQSAYISFTDATGCNLYACSYDGSKMLCPPSATLTQGSCSVMRTAASGSHYFAAALTGTGFVTPAIDGVTQSNYAASVDTQSIVATTAGPTDFRIVWRSAGTLFTTTFPAAASESHVTTNTTGYTGPGAGFDAVGDGPTLPGYAVVYYQSDANAPSIQLVHRCK